jgi:hypothetical protein
VLHGASGIAEFIRRVLVGETAEAQELADPLTSVELQLGRTRGEEQPPQLAGTE